MGKKDTHKYERLQNLIQLLLDHPEGLTRAEIARRLGVNRSTAGRYLDELSLPDGLHAPVYEVSPERYTIDRDAYRVEISVNIHEALAILLAARLLTTRTDKHYPAAAAALRKLARELEKLAPQFSLHMKRAADALDGLHRRQDSAFLEVLYSLTQAWSRGSKVYLTHEMEDGQTFAYTFAPYFIEPYAIGRTMHVIGLREPPGEIRTFKIERIRTIRILDESYTIPDSFDPSEYLKDAWGIWTAESAPQTIRLRFSPRVAKRVQETLWHHTQQIMPQPDSSLIWQAQIADWREMLPWIRGWGADCEVLEPENLRKQMEQEIQKMANAYGVLIQRSPLYALWAKTDRRDEQMHPLLYHLIDVGECARLLWESGLSTSLKSQIASDLKCSLQESENLFAFLAALHDIGKASPAYQTRYPPSPTALKELQALGFTLPDSPITHFVSHGTVSTHILKDLLQAIQSDQYINRRLAHAVGGHHGLWPSTLDVQTLDDKAHSQKGDGLWETMQRELFTILWKLYKPPENFGFPSDTVAQNRLLTLLSGFITAADWLGSIQTFFDFQGKILPPEVYRQQATANAKNALQETGWLDAWQPTGEKTAFEVIFPFLPNQIQKTVLEKATDLSQPALLILEAPTGCGKTEAALYLADTWLQQNAGRGLYVAMPTQATSNQMFERTLEFLKKRYPYEKINIHLAHGQAQWHEAMERLKLYAVGDQLEDHLRAEAWFIPRKRTLLAPFAVGTVDQALLGVLQTRHFFLRLFGLAHKVVIFDEVHAYDAYMEELFLRLLTWLRAIGTSVIVLSATLPYETRQKMLAAWVDSNESTMVETPYPRLTLATPKTSESIPLPTTPDRTIILRWSEDSPQAIADLLADQLAHGGCAAVIFNTVRRAQDVFRVVRDQFPFEECLLFHAQTPFAWREVTEKLILNYFGKDGKRPQRAIVVTTQVIEQSLDLDFDLIISELAPVDLLIQRAGRLHRHLRPHRPVRLKNPTIFLIKPGGTLADPEFGNSKFVYEPYLLWQTWRLLEDRDRLRLPSETDALIQAVYRPFRPEEVPANVRDGLEKAWHTLCQHFENEAYTASQSLVDAPNATDRLVTVPFKNLHDDEDPTLHPQARARTRLIAPSVQIVPLHRQPDGSFNLEPDGSGERLTENATPLTFQIKSILKYTLTVHNPRLVNLLAGESTPWRQHAALRYTYPLIFENGRCIYQDLILTIDPVFGFRVDKETA